MAGIPTHINIRRSDTAMLTLPTCTTATRMFTAPASHDAHQEAGSHYDREAEVGDHGQDR